MLERKSKQQLVDEYLMSGLSNTKKSHVAGIFSYVDKHFDKISLLSLMSGNIFSVKLLHRMRKAGCLGGFLGSAAMHRILNSGESWSFQQWSLISDILDAIKNEEVIDLTNIDLLLSQSLITLELKKKILKKLVIYIAVTKDHYEEIIRCDDVNRLENLLTDIDGIVRYHAKTESRRYVHAPSVYSLEQEQHRRIQSAYKERISEFTSKEKTYDTNQACSLFQQVACGKREAEEPLVSHNNLIKSINYAS